MPFLLGICQLVKIDKAAGKSSNGLLFFFLHKLETSHHFGGLSECECVKGILHSFPYSSEF